MAHALTLKKGLTDKRAKMKEHWHAEWREFKNSQKSEFLTGLL
jgi:hypothetical protein